MICDGLPEGPAPNIKAAGLPGLFDDLPELVSGPSLPAVEKPQCTDCLFAVFDGHGGISAARACAERIPTEIREVPVSEDSFSIFTGHMCLGCQELDAAGRDTPEARQAAAVLSA